MGWRRGDPDETMGRVLYRQRAETEARLSMWPSRKMRLKTDEEMAALEKLIHDRRWERDGFGQLKYGDGKK